jgi:lysophospholipase L1-like esterase
MLNADNKNLGFSGSGKGEQSVAQYIANSDISALIMDNLNISSNEEFEKMFYPFYETVRKAHPDIPIIMVYVSSFYPATDEELNASGKEEFANELVREKAVKAAYKKAVDNGDKNVYYVSAGEYFNRDLADLYTVDAVHPNDLGHYFYAKAIFDVLAPALEKTYPDAKAK